MLTSSVNVWNPPPRQALFFPALFPLSIHLTLHLWKWFHLVLVLFWVSHEHFVLFMPVCTLVNETCLGAILSNGLWGSDTPGLSGFPLPEQGLRASCSVADPYHAAVAALLKQCQPHTWEMLLLLENMNDCNPWPGDLPRYCFIDWDRGSFVPHLWDIFQGT